MPPKRTKKKKIEEAKDLIIDKVNITQCNQEQRIRFFIQKVKDLVELKKKRAFEEQERDLYFRRLELLRDELEKQSNLIICAEAKEQELLLERHREAKVVRQRAHHLKFELERELEAEEKTQALLEQNATSQRLKEQEQILIEAARTGKRIDEERKAFEQSVKETQFQLRVDRAETRKNLSDALQDRFDFFETLREEALDDANVDTHTHKCKAEQDRLERTVALQQNFQRNFTETKQFFQELTYHNITLIDDLRSQHKKMKGDISKLAARLRDINRQNNALREPMRVKAHRLHELKKQVEIFEKDKAAMDRVDKEIISLKAERIKLKQSIAKIGEEYQEVQTEIKEFRSNYAAAANEAKQYFGMGANMVHQKAVYLKSEVDRLKSELQNKIANSEGNLQGVYDQLIELEQKGMQRITLNRNMELAIEKMVKVYNDALKTARYLIEEFELEIDPSVQPFLPMTFQRKQAGKPAEIQRIRQEKPIKSIRLGVPTRTR